MTSNALLMAALKTYPISTDGTSRERMFTVLQLSGRKERYCQHSTFRLNDTEIPTGWQPKSGELSYILNKGLILDPQHRQARNQQSDLCHNCTFNRDSSVFTVRNRPNSPGFSYSNVTVLSGTVTVSYQGWEPYSGNNILEYVRSWRTYDRLRVLSGLYCFERLLDETFVPFQ